MGNDPFGRQPQPVRIGYSGDLRDVEVYLRAVKSFLENRSYDNCERMGNQLMVYPAAVND